METSLATTLEIVITVFAGISAQVLAEFCRVPGIVFLLLFGVVLGSDGLRILHPSQLGVGLEVIVSLSVAIILFDGGLNLGQRDLRRVSGSLRNLISIGALVTLIGGSVAAHWLSEFPWPIAFLYASLVVVTGPTVIGPILKQVQVDRAVSTLLEGEGVLIDPIGAILAVVVLNFVLNGHADPFSLLAGLVTRLGLGALLGVAGGWAMACFLKKAALSEELNNLVALAGLLGLFGLSQSVMSESGLMAVVVAGLVLRASEVPTERLLRRFKGQLTVFAVSVLFILLAADLSIASVVALGWGGLFTVLLLMLVVRPVSIALCTWNSDLNFRQKLFLAWIAPRGIVAASVASLFAIVLADHGINGGEAIKALVFLTISMTVVMQGLTARWVAQGLQITSKERTGALIVGCHPLSCLIAQQFKQRGESVVLIDTNPESESLAEGKDLQVLICSAFDDQALEEAGLATLGTFIAMTNNGEVNRVLAERAAQEFDPPRVLAVFPASEKNGSSTPKVNVAFTSDASVKLWNQYLIDDSVKLIQTTLSENANDLAFQSASLAALIETQQLIPLLLERDQQLRIPSHQESWQSGDRLLYLLYSPKPKLLKLLSGDRSAKLMLDQLPEPEVQAIPLPVLAEKLPNPLVEPLPTSSVV
jgi:NhaP-type Na+/H+ or K+/H+ antiporter